ncbi:sigma-70 family RNA polymerase sigma factor [uncultured Aquimarina sp.]|uniref:RNA polymerase sigma factor n=1 Tax=uncultured Aquimarina sp. TaxID=575652 RepID=UPI0026144B61|nr:sigma-70 family RNA polymerase sigma factor [uncultured Aquimarina sp.]
MHVVRNLKIINGIISGDEIILKEFYKKNLPHVRKYIILNSGSEGDVEDIFQDALIIVYQKLKSNSLNIDTSIQAYFLGTCKNIWRSHLRKSQKITYDESLTLKAKEENIITNKIEEIEKEHLYRKYFYKLSNSSKQVLKLFFEGKSMKEIASITGYSEGYTRKKKFEAKKTLMKMIENDPIHNELKERSEKKSSKENIFDLRNLGDILLTR